MKKLFFIFFICNIILVGCSDDKLPQFNQLNKIRVIALTTPTPEVNPGDTVTITPVVSDITATTLKDSVRVCIDLGVSYGVTPNCDNNLSTLSVHSQRSLTLPGLAESWTGAADTFTVTVPSEPVIFAHRSEVEKYNGVNYLVEYTLENSSGEKLQAFKRIVVSSTLKTDKNTNPVATDIFANGVSMTTLPLAQKINLATDVNSGTAQSYQLKNSAGLLVNQTELITVTWMITDGETKYFRSEIGQDNEYTTPEASPSGRSAYVFAVVRDDRGGVTVVKKKF